MGDNRVGGSDVPAGTAEMVRFAFGGGHEATHYYLSRIMLLF